MQGFITSWKLGNDRIIRCPQGDVFLFSLTGVIDQQLAFTLQQAAPFRDSGPCPGRVPVQFASQGGMAARISRLAPEVSFREF